MHNRPPGDVRFPKSFDAAELDRKSRGKLNGSVRVLAKQSINPNSKSTEATFGNSQGSGSRNAGSGIAELECGLSITVPLATAE